LIFVTVGAQMSFDRLVAWADDWAGAAPGREVRAQVGPSRYTPRHLQVLPFLDSPGFRRQVTEADAVVAHAGMGTILTVLEIGTPLLVVPRLGARGETRNDHQLATARRFEAEKLLLAAYDRAAFFARLDGLEGAPVPPRIAAHASEALLARLRAFLVDDPP